MNSKKLQRNLSFFCQILQAGGTGLFFVYQGKYLCLGKCPCPDRGIPQTVGRGYARRDHGDTVNENKLKDRRDIFSAETNVPSGQRRASVPFVLLLANSLKRAV